MGDLIEDLAGQERCIKRSAQSVKKSVKFPSNPGTIVQYTARNVSQSAKIAAVR